MVTIELFKLDDGIKRKNLFLERIIIIQALFAQLERLANGATGATRDKAIKVIELAQSSQFAHSNCARSFIALYNQDPSQAEQFHDAAVAWLLSTS